MVKIAVEVFLAREPQVVVTPSGVKLWKSSFAIQAREKGAAPSQFVEVLAFNGQAKALEEAGLKKGDLVRLEGSLVVDHYTNQEGETVTRLALLVDRAALVVRRKAAEEPQAAEAPGAPEAAAEEVLPF